MGLAVAVLAVAVAVLVLNHLTTTTTPNTAAAFRAGWAAVLAGGKNLGHASPAQISQSSNCQPLSACFKYAFFDRF